MDCEVSPTTILEDKKKDKFHRNKFLLLIQLTEGNLDRILGSCLIALTSIPVLSSAAFVSVMNINSLIKQ